MFDQSPYLILFLILAYEPDIESLFIKCSFYRGLYKRLIEAVRLKDDELVDLLTFLPYGVIQNSVNYDWCGRLPRKVLLCVVLGKQIRQKKNKDQEVKNSLFHYGIEQTYISFLKQIFKLERTALLYETLS